MRSLFNVLLVSTIFLFANSCEKEILDTEIVSPETIDHSRDFLQEHTIELAILSKR